ALRTVTSNRRKVQHFPDRIIDITGSLRSGKSAKHTSSSTGQGQNRSKYPNPEGASLGDPQRYKSVPAKKDGCPTSYSPSRAPVCFCPVELQSLPQVRW